MKKIKYILIIILFISVSLLQGQSLNQLKNKQENWIINITKKNEDINLTDYYLQKYVYNYDGKFVFENDSLEIVLNFFKTNLDKYVSYETKDFIKQESTKYIEIGEIKSGSKSYCCIIGWKFVKNNWFKETEVVYVTEKTDKTIPAVIDSLRGKWVDYSNAHNPESLIKNIYAEDAVYFSNTRTSFGKEIIARYNYMTHPNWSITLTPIKKLRVQQGLVYEIGSYGRGLYFLLWEKTSDGHWKARYDFNF